MERTKNENMINLHTHFFETREFDKANFTPYQFIYLHKALSQLYNYKVITSCGSHNSTTKSKQVWEMYKKYPTLKDSLEIFLQSEFTVDLSTIFRNSPFDKMHLLAAAKKGREDEFFKKTEVYSAWSDMYISKDVEHSRLFYEFDFPKNEDDINNYINIGKMMIAARNILCKKYCKDATERIPFDIYKNTIVCNSYNSIRSIFIDDSFKYLISKGLIENTPEARKKLDYDISFVHKLSIEEKINNFIIDVKEQLNTGRFGVTLDKELPDGLFNEAKRPNTKFDYAKQIVKNILLGYLIKNKYIVESEKTKNELTEKIDNIARSHRTEGLIPVFREIRDEEILKIKSGGENRLPRLYGHPSTRLDLRDLNLLFGDTAHFCLAHPNEEMIRVDAKIPASYFKGVDISKLPQEVQRTINFRLNNYVKYGLDFYFGLDDKYPVIKSYETSDGTSFIGIIGDKTGIVKDEMLINFLDRVGRTFNFTIDGVEISKKMFFESKEGKNLHAENAWEHFDMYVKHKKAVNCVSAIGDIHYDYLSDLALISNKMSYKKHCRNFNSDLTFICTDCSWYHLLKDGTFDKVNQILSVKYLKEFLSRKYGKFIHNKEKISNEEVF